MKKTISFILAIALLATVALTGCTGAATSSAAGAASSKAEPASSAQASSETKLDPATLQVWLLGPGKQQDSDAVWEKFNKNLQEALPNTTVEITVYTGAEYKEKFNNMLASGEKVDLAWVGYATSLAQDQQDGNLMALDELLDKYGSGIKESLGEKVLDMHRYSDGKLYYLINWQSLFAGRNGIQIPTELAKLSGDSWVSDTQKLADTMCSNPSIENVQAVYDQMEKYYQACIDNNKIYGGMGMTTFMYDSIFTGGGRSIGTTNVKVMYGDDTFTVISAPDTDYYRLYVKTVADYYKKGYIASDVASKEYGNWQDNPDGTFDANDPVSISHNAYTDSFAQTEGLRDHRELSIITLHKNGILSLGSATGMSIPFCADEPERAMMFLNEMYTNAELYQLLIYGEENVHWTDNGDGTVTTLSTGVGRTDDKYGLWKWTIGTCMNALTTQADQKGYYQELQEKEKTAYISPLLQFTFNNSSVADIVTSLNAIDKEYDSMLNYGYMGDKWEETYNKYIAERKAAGEAELIAEYQKQLNEYLKANNITSWNYKHQ